jgi:hypothetical protein
LFSYEGGGNGISVVQRMDPNKNTDKIYFTDRHVNSRWLIEDTHLSFDMNGAHSQALFFDFLVYSHAIGNINISGTIGSEGVNAASLGVMSTAANTLKSVAAGYSAGSHGTKDAANVAISVGQKINSLGGNGQEIIDLGNKALNLASGVGVVMAGSELIKGFIGWTGGGQMGMAPSVVSLNGTISFVNSTTNPMIPLANANFTITDQQALFARTYNTTGDKNLGLYVLNVAPDVKFVYTQSGPYTDGRMPNYYLRTYYISVADPTCGLYINPASGAKLKQIKIRPEVYIPSRFVYTGDGHIGSVRVGESKFDPDFQAPSYWNRVAASNGMRIYGTGTTTSLDNIQVNLKISIVLDIGRGETMEFVNSYSPQKVTYTPTVTGPRDYGTCTAPDFLRSALDQTSGNLTFQSSSSGPNWYTLFGYPGAVNSSVAASGKIGDGEYSTMSTTVTGQAASFRWKVSSEPNYDFLTVLVDGNVQARISGNVDWTTQTLSYPYGTHTITWEYHRDGSLEWGEDRGMVDNFTNW